jgi:hypothetical protein
MKKIAIAVFMLVLIPVISVAASSNVRGSWRDTDHDGIKDTYVQPHQRTTPNQSRTDNYGHPGNYNPNSGSITPQSDSPRENYPSNPSPYEKRKNSGSLY